MPVTPLPSGITLRAAIEADLPFINAIYNHYVLHSTATFQTEPATAQERENWFAEHKPAHPIIVAIEGAADIVGWGSLSKFHSRAAYQPTVENSVYVRHDRLGRGIGQMLLSELIRLAGAGGYHSIVAVISADQTPSIRLHESFGFTTVGLLKEVGHKFDRRLDVAYMQRMV